MTHDISYIDNIKFGNPSITQKKLLEKDSFLDNMFQELSNNPYSPNSSDQTKSELNEICNRLTSIVLEANKEHLNRYFASYQNLNQFLINNLITPGINLHELLTNLINDISPLITRLQFKYQRPQPRVLAFYYKLSLFPILTKKEEIPSYPNFNVILTFLFCSIVGNRHTDLHEKSQKIINFITTRDSYLGNSYMSDIDFSLKIGNLILKHKEFASKYNI